MWVAVYGDLTFLRKIYLFSGHTLNLLCHVFFWNSTNIIVSFRSLFLPLCTKIILQIREYYETDVRRCQLTYKHNNYIAVMLTHNVCEIVNSMPMLHFKTYILVHVTNRLNAIITYIRIVMRRRCTVFAVSSVAVNRQVKGEKPNGTRKSLIFTALEITTDYSRLAKLTHV